MSMTKGTPESSQMITMARLLEEKDDEIERLREESAKWKSLYEANTMLIDIHKRRTDREAMLAKAPQPPAVSAEPIGEVVWAGGRIGTMQEVKWRDHVCPKVGTKLYLAPPSADAKEAEEIDVSGDIQDIASKAMKKAWQLGQTYWQQADSEYQSQWKRADATEAAFQRLIDETIAAIDAARRAIVRARR